MKWFWLTAIIGCLCANSVRAEPEGYVDGHDWQVFTSDYKLALVQGTQEKLRDRGTTTTYSAEFYVEAVNKFYSDPDRLTINFADAMSAIGFPLGDFKEVPPEPEPSSPAVESAVL